MAAPVVASSSTNSAAASSVVVTKPTGVAVGDVLVAIVTAYDTGAIELDTPSGWTRQHYPTSPTNRRWALYTKIANSGDVSASDYTFSTGGAANAVIAGIARITGAASGNEIAATEYDEASSTASPSFTGTSTPASADTLVLMAICTNGTAGVPTVSSYASTPAMTWTEVFDASLDFSSEDPSVALASAVTANTTQITAYSASLSTSKSTIWGSLLLIQPVVNASADVGHLAVTPTLVGLETTNTATASVGHLNASPTLIGLDAVSSSDGTQWTNESKNTSIWTNESKS